jgi:hypothetical protein
MSGNYPPFSSLKDSIFTAPVFVNVRLISGFTMMKHSFLYGSYVVSYQLIITLHWYDSSEPCVVQGYNGHMQIHIFTWKEVLHQ